MAPSTLLLVLSLGLVRTALAHHEPAATKCDIVGEECSYIYYGQDSNEVEVRGLCAPNLYCADNGAACESDVNCVGSCGWDGVCGGAGSSCTSLQKFSHEVPFACSTPAFTCSLSNSTCVASAPSSFLRTQTRRTSQKPLSSTSTHAVCPRVSQQACKVKGEGGGRWECIDVRSSATACGGCPGVGEDCTRIEGAAGVECVDSQ